MFKLHFSLSNLHSCPGTQNMQQSLDMRECLITANWLIFKQDMSASRKMIGDLTDFFSFELYIYL